MVVVNLGYSTNLVVTKEDAMTLISVLERAYSWDEKYVSKNDSETGESHYLYYAYPCTNMPTMKIINDEVYTMAKLAGKPA
jgi:hypothetical protein